MNFNMARRWNERVAPGDTVYHLGDFAMGDPDSYPAYREKLQGNVILVSGNHDDKMELMMSQMGFADVVEKVTVAVGGARLWLNHYPLDVPDHRDRPLATPVAPGAFDFALCGHVHQQFRVSGENVNVGVDVWDFNPISVQEIQATLLAASITSL